MASSSGIRKDSNPPLKVNTLSAIRYKRGILEVLDQRKLPHEIVYKKIDGIADGWRAVRSMMGRGTSAIAIAAALSLAVEVSHFKSYNWTSQDPAFYIESSFNYLLASKPKTVIIPETITRLKQIASNAVASGKSPMAVFKLYKEAAEAMLHEDVESGKDIATYGSALLSVQLKNPTGRFSVLTQPNTGSLATSEYGTVHGIIPALEKIGVLERVFYTVKDPFCQESKPEAFKMRHESFPATLIARSSVATLMQLGSVNAVVVAVDHIAENGDTVNKVGTLGLAICAEYCCIPFYVAAPIASIDFSRSTGKEFPKFALQDEGPTSSRFPIMNPAFDVISANYIAAIITEKGIIEKNNNTFDIRGFVATFLKNSNF